jgi:integrase
VPLSKYWGDVKVADLNAGSIRQAALDILPSAKTSTRNRQVIVPTQAVINHCAELELCPHLKVKRPRVESKIKQPVTLEWVNTFCAHATRSDIAAIALFMFSTGARISEALMVQWADLDFKNRTVLIRQTKIGNERVAHLPRELMLMLANLPRGKKPFAFAGHSSALGAWQATIQRAGIEPLSFHSCRHGFATGLLRAGVDVITVAKLGGWKSAQHVFQTYGHADDNMTLTDRLFDTSADTVSTLPKTNQDVK